MEVIYTTLAAHLMENVTGLMYVSLFNNQFARMEMKEVDIDLVPMPAVLVQIDIPSWTSDNGGEVQRGQATVRLHIGQEIWADPAQGSESQDTALDVIRFITLVHTQAHGISGEGFTALKRVAGPLSDTDYTNLIVHVLEYTCELTDDSADSRRDWVPVTPDLDLTVEVGELPAAMPPPPVPVVTIKVNS